MAPESEPSAAARRVYPAHRGVTAQEAREADREATLQFGIPTLVLMEHAGRGLASLVAARLSVDGSAAILCGPGANGGDGYACGRFLAGWGLDVRIVRCAPARPSGTEAALEYDLLARERSVRAAASGADRHVVEEALAGASVVVDALFGVGLSRPLEDPYPLWVALVNAAPVVRICADLPSGLADDGRALPVAVRAHLTAAMGFPKACCLPPSPGAAFAGEVVEVDVGLPGSLHRRFLA